MLPGIFFKRRLLLFETLVAVLAYCLPVQIISSFPLAADQRTVMPPELFDFIPARQGLYSFPVRRNHHSQHGNCHGIDVMIFAGEIPFPEVLCLPPETGARVLFAEHVFQFYMDVWDRLV